MASGLPDWRCQSATGSRRLQLRRMAEASVALDCPGSDSCSVDVVTDLGTATPLAYQWSFKIPPGVAVIFKKDCTNRSYCAFYCPYQAGTLTATITVKDATGAVLGTDSQPAGCTQQPQAG